MSDKSVKKKKVLFLIHDLGQGGAEKVLVNLLNNMNRNVFDITLISLFGGGVNEQYLKDDIHYRSVFPFVFRGNKHLMKLLSPQQLHSLLIKDVYDIEVSYLEGPSARIISGCKEAKTKLVTWIHIQQDSAERSSKSFRSINEAMKCYGRFDRIIGVSEYVKSTFQKAFPVSVPMQVLYNTNESDDIKRAAEESVQDGLFSPNEIKLVCVGKLLKSKGFDRIVRIIEKLRQEGFPVHLYILGSGPLKNELETYIAEKNLNSNVTLLGYQTNPYKYVSKCDLFVCASYAEGFSTAATEALIVGTPVCTVEVSGMREMLGNNNEWGIVTANDDISLYTEIRRLISDQELLQHYKEKALERGNFFSKEETVKAVESMLLSL